MPRDPLAILFAVAAAIALAGMPGPGDAQDGPVEIGGDVFLTTDQPRLDASRDVFAAGWSTALSGTVGDDAHAAGVSVEIDAATAGDLYAAGLSVSLRGPVGGDLNAIGGTVRTHAPADTTGNARLSGGTVTVEGPVGGALLASAGEIVLNAPIAGDAWLSAPRIRFGENASVGGQLRYATFEPLDIPESVADPARVTYERLAPNDVFAARDEDWPFPERPDMRIGAGTVAAGLALSIGSFLIVGALFLGFAPRLVSNLRKRVTGRPAMTALTGLIGLSMLFGAVPILGLSILGLPLVPLALIAVVIFWYLGYVLGAYSVGMGLARALGLTDDPSIPIRLGVLAATALVAALLNFIPILGWMANFVLVLFGIGAVVSALFDRMLPSADWPESVHA